MRASLQSKSQVALSPWAHDSHRDAWRLDVGNQDAAGLVEAGTAELEASIVRRTHGFAGGGDLTGIQVDVFLAEDVGLAGRVREAPEGAAQGVNTPS